MNLPDHITLPPTAVRIPTKKSFILRNLGEVPSLFVVHFEEPFSMYPPKGCLVANDYMEMEVTCKPIKSTTPLVGEIIFKYNDVKVAVTVECDVLEVDVSIEIPSLGFDELYITLKSHKSFRVFNR